MNIRSSREENVLGGCDFSDGWWYSVSVEKSEKHLIVKGCVDDAGRRSLTYGAPIVLEL